MVPGEKGIVDVQVEAWIRQKVAFPDRRLGKCVKLVLRHLSLDKKNQGDVAIFHPNFEGDQFDPLLHEIVAAAQDDADTLNAGVQTYALCAYYSEDKTACLRKVFRVSASETESERDLTPSEPATAGGLVAQAMRHMEAIMKTATITQGYQLQAMRSELERTAEMNRKFMDGHVDLMVLIQDVLDNAHRRRLEERAEESKQAMQDAAFAKLDTLLPVLINRIAGKQLLPEEDKSMMMMGQLLEGLDDAQQQQILASLSDSQKILLAEVMSAYEQKKSKWLAEKVRVASGQPPLGAANTLPPPSLPGVPSSTTLAVLPHASPLRDLAREPIPPSSDPKIQQLERDGAAFARRFRDKLTPEVPDNPKKPEGEPS